ncbi:MAG: phosphatase PAP2 family protein [Paramuribaculum sp.]|nr:phosphatase PAP2 family protein [Paramuribaculum sp.]
MIARVLNPKWTYIPLLLSFLSLILIVAALTNGFSYDIISRIDYVDGQIVRAINGTHSPFWDSFMYQFTQKWLWVPFYVTIVAFLSMNFTLKQMFFITISIVLVILLADQICAGVLRPMFARFRPSHSPLADTLHFVNGYRGGNYGFPSCHAANAVALATFLSYICRNHRVTSLLTVWFVLMGLTRMYLGVHYPSDLIVGSIIGILIGGGIGSLCCRFSNVRPITESRLIWLPWTAFGLTCLWIVGRYLADTFA